MPKIKPESNQIKHLRNLVSNSGGLYETPSEYVRDLIRRDMERRDGQMAQDAILSGYRDLAAGRVLVSSGDFKTDMEALDRKQADGWQ